MLPVDNGRNNPFRESEILDGLSGPSVFGRQLKAEKIQLALAGLFAFRLHLGILLDKSG